MMLLTETFVVCSLLISLYGEVSSNTVRSYPSMPCRAKGLARYNLTFYTHWSEEDFPKQYPHFRPPAQWSKLIGRSHNQYYRMWQYDELTSDSLKLFVEKSDSSKLEQEVQGQMGVFDVFNAPAISTGVGVASTKIFVDEYHSKVTAVSHIIPSPDWFVGVDSVDLCDGYRWKDSVSIDLDPNDAGTDQGFTFTAPNWADQVPKGISKITNLVPNHPANSFYYPDIAQLPRIAHIVFTKVNTYSFKEGTVDMDLPPPGGYSDDAQADSPASGGSSRETGLSVAPDGEPRFVPRGNPQESSSIYKIPKSSGPTRKPFSSNVYGRPSTRAPTQRGPPTRPPVVLRPRPTPAPSKRPRPSGRRVGNRRRNRKNRRREQQERQTRGPRIPCQVSDFGEWSACSKSCGFGSKTRTRNVIVRPQNNGQVCPALQETEVCVVQACKWNHFNNNNWDRKKQPTAPKRTSLFSAFSFQNKGGSTG